MGTPKKYHLLYLPTGTLVEILGPAQDGNVVTRIEWRKLSKSRQDLKKVLVRILQGNFPPKFYEHNEMLRPPTLSSCHFIFQKTSKLIQPQESE